MTEFGELFLGPVPEVKGVWIGAGHSFWGITLGPGTGKVLSEMVLGEELSADISPLSLEREG
jgi:glycine/D-amino acid oxidase-like deaminating enzyme